MQVPQKCTRGDSGVSSSMYNQAKKLIDRTPCLTSSK